MYYRFFHIPVTEQQESTEALNSFLQQHRILSCKESFVEAGINSYWAISVTYLFEGQSAISIQEKAKGDYSKKPDIDYKEILDDDDFLVFSRLRNLRKELSQEAGVPSYVLFTNAQLADLVTEKVVSKEQMLAIKGIGKSRVTKYGEPFLKLLVESFSSGESE